MPEKTQQSKDKPTAETRVYDVIRRLKSGKMPRRKSRLGALLYDVEEGLIAELGPNVSATNTIKIALTLQMMVMVAGLPMFTNNKRDVHNGYRWAMDHLRELLNELGKPTPPKKPPAKAPSLEDIIGQDQE